VAILCCNSCFQGRPKLEERGRPELQGGVTAATQSRSPNVSDVVTKSVTERPESSERNRDEMMKQIRQLNKALELSEEAVRTSYRYRHLLRHLHLSSSASSCVVVVIYSLLILIC